MTPTALTKIEVRLATSLVQQRSPCGPVILHFPADCNMSTIIPAQRF